ACATGNTNIVRMILEAGADIEAELPNTDRPLHVALINEQRDMAKLLIVKGANINVRASRSRTPLHLAAEYAVFEAALMLLDKGASTEDVDEETWTPLCCSGHPDMVELLISRGANVDYADKDNWTPLHQAVSNKDYHTAVQLVRAGASVDVRTTDDGLTVMERAKDLNDRRESDRFVELLEREIFWRETRKDSKAEKSKEPECDVVELGGDYVEVSAQGPSIEVGDA
ncbi:ankyrin repeat-containing domain protein, partial [Clohesyomyces aquaticus]